jgi:hypothetical protein
MSTRIFNVIACSLLAAGTPLSASAQTMEDAHSLTFEAPFGQRDAGEGETMINNVRDANLNKVVISSPGWGVSASALGNLINVVEQGSNNTVVINASQINKGSQQATIAAPFAHSSDKTNAAVAPNPNPNGVTPDQANFPLTR